MSDSISRNRRGAVVLCGGRSSRMGRDKASLAFGRETLLERAVRIVSDAVFATACDAPFLSLPLIALLFERLGARDVAVAEADGFTHPLCAVYRTRLAERIEKLVDAKRLRPVYLFDEVPNVRVGEAELRTVDPDLRALRNCNTPDAYEAALADRRPLVRVELYDGARRLAGRERVDVDAATLGDAQSALSLACPALGRALADARHWRWSLGGDRFVDDPATPLADGASLLLLSAQAGG